MRKSRLWFAIGLIAMLATAFVAAGCGDDDEDTTTGATGATGATGDLGLITDGELVVGSDIPYEPFEAGKPPDYEGFDIDLVNAIAEKLDLKVTYEDTAFDTIFRDLAQGKFDMVASAASNLPEREETVDFSDPYFRVQQALLVKAGSDIATIDDVAGETVGAQDGTTGEIAANDESDAKTVRGYPEGADAVTALRNGQVEAVFIDNPTAEDAVESAKGDIEIATVLDTEEFYGLVFQEEDDALREAVNEALAELKDDGTLADIYKEWTPDEELVDSVLDGTNDPT